MALGAALAVIAGLSVWAQAQEASACRCRRNPRPLATRVAAAKKAGYSIFLGTVRWTARGQHLLRVGNVFEGPEDKYVRVRQKSTAACGYAFANGKSYVVFAKGTAGNYANPGSCGGLTTPREQAAALLALLGNGRPPAGDRIPDELDEPCRPGMARPASGGACARIIGSAVVKPLRPRGRPFRPVRRPIAIRPIGVRPFVGVLARTVTCNTAGDSMASLKLSVSGRQKIALHEATMGDKVYDFTAAATSGQVAALANGGALTLLGVAADTNAFGGAHSPAVLLSLGARNASGWTGHYARGGIVFTISCK